MFKKLYIYTFAIIFACCNVGNLEKSLTKTELKNKLKNYKNQPLDICHLENNKKNLKLGVIKNVKYGKKENGEDTEIKISLNNGKEINLYARDILSLNIKEYKNNRNLENTEDIGEKGDSDFDFCKDVTDIISSNYSFYKNKKENNNSKFKVCSEDGYSHNNNRFTNLSDCTINLPMNKDNIVNNNYFDNLKNCIINFNSVNTSSNIQPNNNNKFLKKNNSDYIKINNNILILKNGKKKIDVFNFEEINSRSKEFEKYKKNDKNFKLEDDKFKFISQKILYINDQLIMADQIQDAVKSDFFDIYSCFISCKQARPFEKFIQDIYNGTINSDIDEDDRFNYIKIRSYNEEDFIYCLKAEKYINTYGFSNYKFRKFNRSKNLNSITDSDKILDLTPSKFVTPFNLNYKIDYDHTFKFSSRIKINDEELSHYKKSFTQNFMKNIKGIYPFYNSPDGKIKFLIIIEFKNNFFICSSKISDNEYLITHIWNYNEKNITKLFAFQALYSINHRTILKKNNKKETTMIPPMLIINNINNKI